MAQEFTNTALNVMLDALISNYTTIQVSAHTASPGLTGANEVTGGSYARQTITYNAASTGTKTIVATATIPIPGTPTTVSFLGLWGDATFLGQVDIADETFSSDGNLDVTALTLDLTNHPA